MKRATVAAIGLLMIALAGCAHASDKPETPEICRDMDGYTGLNKYQKEMLEFICERMPFAQRVDKEFILTRNGCAPYPLTEEWLRRYARAIIRTPELANMTNSLHIKGRIVLREQTCRLAERIFKNRAAVAKVRFEMRKEIEKLKDEIRRLKGEVKR